VGVVLLIVLGVVAVASGVVVFVFDSMARASYALAVSFVAVGGILLLLGLDYVGPVVILMMVMEMAIMAVFMVMLMGMNPALMPMDMTARKRPAIVVSVLVFLGLAAAVLLIPWPVRATVGVGETVAALGRSIMGSKMLVMLTIGPVLLATIVSSLVLADPRGRYDRFGDRLERRIPTDPEPGGLPR
jgi:NADH-quinone oxidoreductase subunit J